MNISIKELIKKNPGLYRASIGAVNIVNYGYYKRLCKKTNYSEVIRRLKNKKAGRCFIIGNGPSLTIDDLDLLSSEDCFASNQIFRLFGQTQWRPTYYAVQDIHGGIEQEVDSIEAPVVLVGDNYWRKIGTSNPNAICYHAKRIYGNSVPFSEDVADQGVYDAFTVTYTLMQFAVYFGYSEIYLLGIDHSYRNTIRMDGVREENAQAKNHFYEDSKSHPVMANVEAMERAYLAAKRYADTHEITIANATRGGQLEVFERVDLDSLLGRGSGK